MKFLKDLHAKVALATPGLAEKTAQALKTAQGLAVEAGRKSAPVLKDFGSKAMDFTKEKAPIVKARAEQALNLAIAHRQTKREQADLEKAAHARFVDKMYQPGLAPDDQTFLDEPFTFFGQQFFFFVISGEVVDSNKRDRQNMALNAAHFLDGTSRVSAFNDHSTLHEFWLKKDDGVEMSVSLSNIEIPMRVGQRLSMIYMARTGGTQGHLSVVYNHASGEPVWVHGPADLNEMLSIYTIKPSVFTREDVTGTRDRLFAELHNRIMAVVYHAQCWHDHRIVANG